MIFAFANAVAVAMYVVGFAETVVELLVVSVLDLLGGKNTILCILSRQYVCQVISVRNYYNCCFSYKL